VSKLEYYLWGADFMIGGIGWFFGGPYAGLACFAIGSILILVGLTKGARPRWRKVMEWANPVEWFAWTYGKFFQNHFYIGAAAVMLVFSVLGLILWIRGVDRYKENHPTITEAADKGPKPQTVAATASNSASQSVTVQSASAVPGTPKIISRPSKVGARKESKQVAKKEDEKISKEEEKTPSFELLHLGGTVDEFSATHTTVRGQPSPGTSISMIFVPPGGKAGKIKLNDFDVNFNPVRAIPPPPDSASIGPQLNYKTRVDNLRRNIGDWLVQKEQQQPEYSPIGASDAELHETTIRTREFWENATTDYIRQFGPDITLLASQLQKCEGFQTQIRDIYRRLGYTSQSPGSVSFTVRDLAFVDNLLPSDDSQLLCAEGKHQ